MYLLVESVSAKAVLNKETRRQLARVAEAQGKKDLSEALRTGGKLSPKAQEVFRRTFGSSVQELAEEGISEQQAERIEAETKRRVGLREKIIAQKQVKQLQMKAPIQDAPVSIEGTAIASARGGGTIVQTPSGKLVTVAAGSEIRPREPMASFEPRISGRIQPRPTESRIPEESLPEQAGKAIERVTGFVGRRAEEVRDIALAPSVEFITGVPRGQRQVYGTTFVRPEGQEVETAFGRLIKTDEEGVFFREEPFSPIGGGQVFTRIRITEEGESLIATQEVRAEDKPLVITTREPTGLFKLGEEIKKAEEEFARGTTRRGTPALVLESEGFAGGIQEALRPSSLVIGTAGFFRGLSRDPISTGVSILEQPVVLTFGTTFGGEKVSLKERGSALVGTAFLATGLKGRAKTQPVQESVIAQPQLAKMATIKPITRPISEIYKKPQFKTTKLTREEVKERARDIGQILRSDKDYFTNFYKDIEFKANQLSKPEIRQRAEDIGNILKQNKDYFKNLYKETDFKQPSAIRVISERLGLQKQTFGQESGVFRKTPTGELTGDIVGKRLRFDYGKTYQEFYQTKVQLGAEGRGKLTVSTESRALLPSRTKVGKILDQFTLGKPKLTTKKVDIELSPKEFVGGQETFTATVRRGPKKGQELFSFKTETLDSQLVLRGVRKGQQGIGEKITKFEYRIERTPEVGISKARLPTRPIGDIYKKPKVSLYPKGARPQGRIVRFQDIVKDEGLPKGAVDLGGGLLAKQEVGIKPVQPKLKAQVKARVSQRQKPSQRIATPQIGRQDYSTLSRVMRRSRFLPITETRTDQMQREDSRQETRQIIEPVTIIDVKERTDLKERLDTRTLPKLDMAQITIPALDQPSITKLRPESLLQPPRRTLLRGDTETAKEQQELTGYEVLVRIRGRFVKVNPEPLRKEEALKLGRSLTDDTSARSFKVIRSTRPASDTKALGDAPISKFRSGRQNTTVEKVTFAIDRPTERKQITEKGLKELANRRLLRSRQPKKRSMMPDLLGRTRDRMNKLLPKAKRSKTLLPISKPLFARGR